MHSGLRRSLGIGLVVAAAVALDPAGASAQTAAGFRGGMRVSSLDSGQDTDAISSFVVGGYFGIGLSDRVALQIELAYGRRGAESLRVGDGELDPDAPPSELTMHYLDLPVLLRTGFPGERFLPSFFIGPYAAFLLNCELTPQGESARDCDTAAPAPEEGEEPQIFPRFSPRATDFGMVAGAGLDMALGESTIFVDVRYTLGLLALESGEGSLDARHNGFEISGGFAFPLGR